MTELCAFELCVATATDYSRIFLAYPELAEGCVIRRWCAIR